MQHHLAILWPQYLDAIVTGRKTIECRLGRPGARSMAGVSPGDLVWLKERCGPVRGVVAIERVRRFEPLSPGRLTWLREQFNSGIRAPAAFWNEHREAEAATLIWFAAVCPLKPFRICKRDRQAWIVLARPPVPDGPLVPRHRPLA